MTCGIAFRSYTIGIPSFIPQVGKSWDVMILNLFSSRPDHPLGDPKELKRVIAELPLDNSFRAVDEVYGWYESLMVANDFRVDHLFDVVRQLDEAAQPFIRRLSRDYLQIGRAHV